ncbi:hypothetical protein ACFOLJ_13830 [Rugamonas sp. CCM 8940]|uniref:hypothetical protein n=1 Tax=Rugamonas sp. CCM 8940 TaxID=2765359 RepID=UPI0018F7358E|nr:hypothetical protein [Rugamonas sp. CCM 8940]MBJ7310553.1 hypothetical protein [Rugamonas sp. CCM 8940]
MDKDQKLVDDIATLLRAAGYVGLSVRKDDGDTQLNATREHGGVMLRLAAQVAKAPNRSEHGGPEQHTARFDVHLVPTMEGLDVQLRAQPELAKAMQIPEAHLKHMM